ncbi:MAG: 4-(cytidine 5'-diphospho)-2-C-methyl-D-erythritol kinase [Lachnospirales bacterium]
MVEEKAYGKINLWLNVNKKLCNGYHDLEMIMTQVELHDALILQKTNANVITLDCDKDVGRVEDNLVYKAIKLIKEEYNINEGVHCILKKKIFIGAGMAGGSSDCAAALRGMNKLFDLKLTSKVMERIGVVLGADVPYCIRGGTALVRGIGEKIEKINDMPPTYILLVKPDFSVSTKETFEALKNDDIGYKGGIDDLIAGIRKQNVKVIEKHLHNTLECVILNKYNLLLDIKKYLEDLGVRSLMSGSGPTVFAFFYSRESGEEALMRVKEKYPMFKDVVLTRTRR